MKKKKKQGKTPTSVWELNGVGVRNTRSNLRRISQLSYCIYNIKMYVVLREIFLPEGRFPSLSRDCTDNTVTLPVLRVFHNARDAGFEPETASSVVWSATNEPSHLFTRAGIPLPSHRWRPRPGREQPPSPPCRSSSGSPPLQSK